MNRGGLNIDYTEGFKLEEIGFKRYYNAIKHVLNATEIENTTNTSYRWTMYGTINS